MITRKQIALLHVACSRINMSQENYRALLLREAGVESSKLLYNDGFDKMVRAFERFGFKPAGRKPSYGNRPGMATSAQVVIIRKLWRAYCGAHDEAALNGWLEKYHHVSSLRFLTQDSGRKVITGLKRWRANGRFYPIAPFSPVPLPETSFLKGF